MSLTSTETSRTFELIVARAVVDSAFRDRLLADKQSVIDEYQLGEADRNLLIQLDRVSLDRAREVAALVGVVHLRSGE